MIFKNFFKHFEECIAGFFLSICVLVTILSVILRYFLGISFSWTVELATFSGIWSGFFGASAGIREGTHLGVDILVEKLPQKIKLFVTILSKGIVIAFTFLIAYAAIELITFNIESQQTAYELPVFMWQVYLVIPISFFLMSMRYVFSIVDDLKRKEPVA
jgi:C4-dicarboxylate transporter DctQ subunit